MPWENNSGGDRGPWGGGPNRGPRRGSGPNEPNIDELIEQMRKRMREILPGGGGSSILVVFAVLLTFWGLSGFYRVQADEQGVVLRFGKFLTQTSPGLNYHLPWPIETAITPKVTTVNRVDIGMRGGLEDRRGSNAVTRDVPEESLMLTGDENIVDVDFSVFWVITNAPDFLFNIQNPTGTVKAVAESTMREIIGQNDIQPILTEQRQKNEEQVKALMQQTLDSYGAGIGITQVKMQKVDPPAPLLTLSAMYRPRAPTRNARATRPIATPIAWCRKRKVRPCASAERRKPIVPRPSPRPMVKPHVSPRFTTNIAMRVVLPASACFLRRLSVFSAIPIKLSLIRKAADPGSCLICRSIS